jgi:hypothetical protein
MTSVRSNIQIYAAFVQTWHELYHILDILEPEEGEHAEVMYRFLSRNMVKGAWQATDEEKLIELVLELRDHLSTDQEVEPSDPDEDNLDILYPAFSSALQAKAKAFIHEGGYRRLCSVSSFFLGLVMLSRVRRHYTHAPWFKVTMLNEMLKTHGGVSICIQCDQVCSYGFSSLRNSCWRVSSCWRSLRTRKSHH